MLTDQQLTWIFKNRLSSSNGFRCGRYNRENGVGPKILCPGRAVITNGKLKVTDTCGEPCTWVCEEANALAYAIETVQQYDKIIEESTSCVRPGPRAEEAVTMTKLKPFPHGALSEMTLEELKVEHAYWDKKICEAKAWGAALSAAHEFRRDCAREIAKRGA